MPRKIVNLLLLIPALMIQHAYADKPNQKLSLGYFHEDTCWTAELNGCEVEGIELSYQQDYANHFFITSLGYFASRQLTAPNGKPMLQSTTFSLGIGQYLPGYKPGHTWLEWSWLIALRYQADDDYQNKNANGGYEVRSLWSQSGTDNRLSWGAELAYQHYQNCSNDDCHLQGASKPVISNLQLVLKLFYSLKTNWSLSYLVSDIEVLSADSRYNGRDPDSLTQRIQLTRFF